MVPATYMATHTHAARELSDRHATALDAATHRTGGKVGQRTVVDDVICEKVLLCGVVEADFAGVPNEATCDVRVHSFPKPSYTLAFPDVSGNLHYLGLPRCGLHLRLDYISWVHNDDAGSPGDPSIKK